MKTSNYRVPAFNCNFGNDLQLHTNYRVINSKRAYSCRKCCLI